MLSILMLGLAVYLIWYYRCLFLGRMPDNEARHFRFNVLFVVSLFLTVISGLYFALGLNFNTPKWQLILYLATALIALATAVKSLIRK